MMTRLARFTLSIFVPLCLLWSSPVTAQIGSVPYPAVSGTVIRSAEYNANFNQVYADALNRNGGAMLGTLTTLGILPTANNVSDIGATGTRYATVYTVNLNASGTTTLSTITCTGCVTSTNILNDTILNADINTAAAIAYSKLNLSASIVNADISASAAIELSKLATTGSFTATSVNDSVGSMATIRAGGIGIASQAQYDMIYASGATQLARVANGTTGQVWTATTGGAPGWGAPPSALFTRFSTIYETVTGRFTSTVSEAGSTPAVSAIGVGSLGAASASSGGSGVSFAHSPTGPFATPPKFGFASLCSLTTVGSDLSGFIGMVPTVPAYAGAPTYTAKHFGFKLARASSGNLILSATQADGTTQTLTTLDSTIVQSDSLVLLARVNVAGTGIEYYYWKNGTAVVGPTTITTNLPTGAYALYHTVGVNNAGTTANVTMACSGTEVFYGG